ncbi:MAG: hypothetical protein Q9227_004807 [Pyrenula ochraceoflavens]
MGSLAIVALHLCCTYATVMTPIPVPFARYIIAVLVFASAFTWDPFVTVLAGASLLMVLCPSQDDDQVQLEGGWENPDHVSEFEQQQRAELRDHRLKKLEKQRRVARLARNGTPVAGHTGAKQFPSGVWAPC